MNGPLESIARELKFDGDTIMEGFVVSIFVVGAFIGSVGGGVLADTLGRRRTFQLDAIPLILGAALR
jgi:MFS family permease